MDHRRWTVYDFAYHTGIPLEDVRKITPDVQEALRGLIKDDPLFRFQNKLNTT